MTNTKINKLLIPNISKLPGDKKVDLTSKITGENTSVNRDEFKNLLKKTIQETKDSHGIQLTLHAAKRLQERDMNMDKSEISSLKSAIEKLRSKGGQDSLVITKKAAYVVDVEGNKIVTAMNKNNMVDNVFTKIDSTLIID